MRSSASLPAAAVELVDGSPFEGLDTSTARILTALFYTGTTAASGAAQLTAIEKSIEAGEDLTSEAFDHKLHQLAGSSLQAGALRLGRTFQKYRSDPAASGTMWVGGNLAQLAFVAQKMRIGPFANAN